MATFPFPSEDTSVLFYGFPCCHLVIENSAVTLMFLCKGMCIFSLVAFGVSSLSLSSCSIFVSRYVFPPDPIRKVFSFLKL